MPQQPTKEVCEIEKAYPDAYRLARKFHELYEKSAPQFGYETRGDTKEFDPESPNGRTMAYVCKTIVDEEIESAIMASPKEVCEWEKRLAKLNGIENFREHPSGFYTVVNFIRQLLSSAREEADQRVAEAVKEERERINSIILKNKIPKMHEILELIN